MHLTSWPDNQFVGLTPALKRLYSLCPTQDTQTHLLHLASYGEILPHVDNVSASGSWILGVSLGSERRLRMEGPPGPYSMFDISLPSGSVYLQRFVSLPLLTIKIPDIPSRDSMRFNYKHSISGCDADFAFHNVTRIDQRLSIMIRVRLMYLGELHHLIIFLLGSPRYVILSWKSMCPLEHALWVSSTPNSHKYKWDVP